MYIAEVDARGLFREHAYSSIFHFLAEALHMSEGQAALRMNAARLVRKFPVIISLLATGAVHLTALQRRECGRQSPQLASAGQVDAQAQ